MPIPIVLGGRSISGQTLEKSGGRSESTHSGGGEKLLHPHVLYETVGWTVCPNHEWSARVICSYYDLSISTYDAKTRDSTMVEVRIQISPLARPLSAVYRETIHHLKLREEGTELSKDLCKRQPQVVISGDRRNLAVLLSHPHRNGSALVFFQLRKPRADLSAAVTSKRPIPLPSYVEGVGSDAMAFTMTGRDAPAVATHPRFVSIWGITTMACLPSTVNPSIFLAVVYDGSFVWVDARSSLAVAIGHLKCTAEQKEDWLPITTLRLSPSSGMKIGQGVILTRSGGAIAVQWDLQKKISKGQQPVASVDSGVLVAEFSPTTFPNDSEDPMPRRQMTLKVLSVLKDHSVRDAQFTRLPSVVCLLYNPAFFDATVAEICAFGNDRSTKFIQGLVLSRDKIVQACRVQSSKHINVVGPEINASPQSRCGLDYDHASDTFAVSIMYEEASKWVGCLWNWRHNVLGWTLQQPRPALPLNNGCWSRLYFCRYPQYANYLVMLETSYTTEHNVYLHKESVATGTLCPSSQNDVPVLESNSLVLARDSIHFPESVNGLGPETFELDWKVAALPTNYLNAYGPPSLASCGRRYEHSIAVAAARGVCVLDRYLRWRQFGTPGEEKSFKVVAMTWWEGVEIHSGPEELTDDLLVAVIQADTGRQYLSCWSSKRLDFAHQLLVGYHSSECEEGSSKLSWGIQLDEGSTRPCLSLLSEPYCTKRRGVVLLASKEKDSAEFKYHVYRLQASKAKLNLTFSDDNSGSKPYTINAYEVVHGSVALETNATTGTLWSALLAGASFDFDLESDYHGNPEPEEMIATLGVVRCPGGLDAISLIGMNSLSASVLSGGDPVNVSMSDVVCDRSAEPGKESHSLDAFVWRVELLCGETYCWMVPYQLRGESIDSQTRTFRFAQDRRRSKLLRTATLVGSLEDFGSPFGVVYNVGTVSSWMQQSSSGTQCDLMLGQVPHSGFGCILRAGQHTRTIRPPCHSRDPETQKEIESDLHEPSRLQLVAPAFVSSLYMLLLEAAFLRMDMTIPDELSAKETPKLSADNVWSLRIIEKHAEFRLRECRNMDASMMALRLLVFRSLEKLSQCNTKHILFEPRSSLALCAALFAGIVDLVRQFCTDLQFAFLFVEVGRQIEPNLLGYLFPLPATLSLISDRPTNIVVAETTTLDRTTAKTIAELFNMSVYAGSLQASSSCLPLFSSQRQMTSLFERALRALIDNFEVSQSTFDGTVEERQVIGDLFRYGVRVEDAVDHDFVAIQAFQKERTLKEKRDKLSESATQHNLDGSDYFSTDDEEVDAENNGRASLTGAICVRSINRDSSSSSILGSMFYGGRCYQSERAISRAASSFIESRHEWAWMEFHRPSLNEDSRLGSFSTEDESDCNCTTDSNSQGSSTGRGDAFHEHSEPAPSSVAIVVGKAILYMLRSRGMWHRWSALGVLSRILVQSSTPSASANILSETIHRVRPADMEALLRSLDLEKDDNSMLLCFLSGEISLCSAQLQVTQAAASIVDLSLFLLDRVAEIHDCPRDVLSALVLTAVVATHCSGETAALLEALGKTNYMAKSLRSFLS